MHRPISRWEKKYKMLKALNIFGTLNQRELARRTQLHVDQVSKLLPDLEEVGFVERKTGKGREKSVRLTPEGKKLVTLLEFSRECLPVGEYGKGSVLEKYSDEKGKCINVDRDSEFSFPEMPNTMIELAKSGVMSEVGVKLNTKKDRHAKDALERVLRESMDVLIVPEPLVTGKDEYRKIVDPENAIRKTEVICRMGTSLLYLVEISDDKKKPRDLNMLGGAAAEEYVARVDKSFLKSYLRRGYRYESVDRPEELFQIGVESLESERPVYILVKPPQNIIFRMLTFLESHSQKGSGKKDGIKVRRILPYKELRDCIIARKQFVEEHFDVVLKIGEIAEVHEKNLGFKKLGYDDVLSRKPEEANPIYRNYSALIQLDLLCKTSRKSAREVRELSELLEVYRKNRLELASNILDDKHLKKYLFEKVKSSQIELYSS